jgi:hypothetical protein
MRTMTLAGVLALGSLLGTGAGRAQAQLFINTPGFSLGVGAPAVGVYPGYGVYPYAPPVVAAYPVPVRPYPYVVGRPGIYGPRPYAPYYARPGYHRR